MSSEIKDIIEKISSYNILTTLLPGAVFAVLAQRLTNHHFVQPDLLTAIAFYYFLGLVLSRIGATVVEPTLRAIKLLTTRSYEDYLSASERDEMLPKLVEAGNTYRTMVALGLSIAGLFLYDYSAAAFAMNKQSKQVALLAGLTLLFVVAFIRNSRFISERVDHQKTPTTEQPPATFKNDKPT